MLAEAGGATVSVFQQFVQYGGPITWFVLIPLSMVTIALVIHYLVVVRRGAQMPASLGRALVAAARQGQLRGMREITREDDTMLGQAAYAGVSQLGSGRDAARAAIDEAVEERATKLLRRIEYLNVIGNVSPMVGLLGTVLGMINAFTEIFAAGGGMPDPGNLARDIAVALVTTFWGILIAIPALTTFALFRNRIDAFAAECVKTCDELVSVASQARPVEDAAGASAPITAPPMPPRPSRPAAAPRLTREGSPSAGE
jgi:biopolymer transport protein ExbB